MKRRTEGIYFGELLVVFAIIAFWRRYCYGVRKARKSGKAAACISNLRQVGIAIQLYAQENNNQLPFMNDQYPGTTNQYPAQTPSFESPGKLERFEMSVGQMEAETQSQLPAAMATYFDQTGSS